MIKSCILNILSLKKKVDNDWNLRWGCKKTISGAWIYIFKADWLEVSYVYVLLKNRIFEVTNFRQSHSFKFYYKGVHNKEDFNTQKQVIFFLLV